MSQTGYDFRYLDHTADIAMEARGESPAAAFASAARAMFEVLADLSAVQEHESREVKVTSADLETLLVDWLGELLYLFEVEHLLLSRFEVREVQGDSFSATVFGEVVDPSRHTMRTGIKAVTYHMLSVKCDGSGCTATVVFDV